MTSKLNTKASAFGRGYPYPLVVDSSSPKGVEPPKDSTRSQMSYVTASPIKRPGIAKVPLIRLKPPNKPISERNERLICLNERLAELEAEDAIMLSAFFLLLETWYFSVVLAVSWCWGVVSGVCGAVASVVLAVLEQFKRIAAVSILLLTRVVLTGIKLLLFGVTSMAYD